MIEVLSVALNAVAALVVLAFLALAVVTVSAAWSPAPAGLVCARCTTRRNSGCGCGSVPTALEN